MTSSERQLEEELIAKLKELKYRYREDVHDRATLEANFRDQFQQLNRVKLTDEEFQRLLEEIITPDVFTAAQTVVDRKDLDRQTRKEFKRFQEGCVEANTNTGFLVQRLISDDAADKVIVCTVQRLGLALEENSKRNKSREKRGLATYVDQLEALRDKHTVFIFDECHRSQFGDNHQAIKEFFPQAQILGFTGTPIFEANASTQQISGEEKTLKTTQDLFQPCLHEYTITHAIEDYNVLRFHVDYYKPDSSLSPPKQGETLTKRAIVDAILAKHDIATAERKFNVILAGLGYVRQIRQWRRQGYHISLFFLRLPNAVTAIARVAERVRQGGHDISGAVIRRRFAAGLKNLEQVYRAEVHAWAVYDNVGQEPILLQ